MHREGVKRTLSTSGNRRTNKIFIKIIVVGLALLATFNAVRFHVKITDDASHVDYPTNGGTMTQRVVDNNEKRDNICPDVWGYFYDESNATHGRTYLEDLYEKSNEYHNLGGNYKALSAFMDRAVDDTYDIVGLTPFVPSDGERRVGSSVVEFIREELRREDDQNRGGYFQRNFPGKFRREHVWENQYQSLFQNGRSITSVMEPVTVERWDIAMGPKLEERSCKGFKMLKKKWDQTKYLCGWDRLLKSSSNLTESGYNNREENSCNVISIGSNDQWAFEEDMVAYTACTIHTFDCTVQHPKNKPDTDQVRFHSVCITGDPNLPNNSTINGRKYATYFDMIRLVGLSQQQSITYLKIDVEGYEWDVFINMVREAKARNLERLLPQQIMVEFHYATWMYDLPWAMRAVQTGELMSVFSMMFREAGYLSVFNEKSFSPMLKEVLLIRIYC